MTISDDLFQLIKSLKQTEKRYFKLYATLHVKGERNNYERLFDAIDRQDAYDEAALLEEFAGESFTKQFAVTKNYLYNFILRSLRGYYGGNSAESRIAEDLASVRILFGKGHYKRSLKLLARTKKMCGEFDKHEQLLAVIRWENEVSTRHLKGIALDEYRSRSAAESKEALEILEHKHRVTMLEQQAFRLYRRYTVARSDEDLEAYRAILMDPALADNNLPVSFIGKLSWYNIKGVYATLSEDHEAAYEYDHLRLQEFEDQPQYIREYLIQYIKVQNNMLHNYLELNDLERFEDTLKTVRATCAKFSSVITPTQEAILFETTYSLELDHLYRTLQFDRALKRVPEIDELLARFDNLLVIEFRTEILFTIAKLYYYSGFLDEASDWVNRIVFDEKPNAADDLLCFARLLNLMVHFDLGNFELLKYELKSTKRFLAKKKRLFKVEALTLKSMGRLVRHTEAEEQRAEFADFQAELETLLQHRYEEHAHDYLNLHSWIRSKTEGRPLPEIVRERFEAERKD